MSVWVPGGVAEPLQMSFSMPGSDPGMHDSAGAKYNKAKKDESTLTHHTSEETDTKIYIIKYTVHIEWKLNVQDIGDTTS